MMKKYESIARGPNISLGDVEVIFEQEMNPNQEGSIGWWFNSENPAFFFPILDSESTTGFSWLVPRFFVNPEKTQISLVVVWIKGDTWEMNREVLFTKTRDPSADSSDLSFSATYHPVLNNSHGVVFQITCKGIGVSNWDTITADEPYRTGTTEPSEVFVLYSKQEGLVSFEEGLRRKFARKGRWVHQLASVIGPIPDTNLGGLSQNGACGHIHMVIKKKNSDDLLIAVNQPPAAIDYYGSAQITDASDSEIADLPEAGGSGYVFYTVTRNGGFLSELRSGASAGYIKNFGQFHAYWDDMEEGKILYSTHGAGTLTNLRFNYRLYNPLDTRQSWEFFYGEVAPWVFEKEGKVYFSAAYANGMGRGYSREIEDTPSPAPYFYNPYTYGVPPRLTIENLPKNGLYQVAIKTGNSSEAHFPKDGKIDVYLPDIGASILAIYPKGQGLDASPEGDTLIFWRGDPNNSFDLPAENRFFLEAAKASPFVKHIPEEKRIEMLLLFSNNPPLNWNLPESRLTFYKLSLKYGEGRNATQNLSVTIGSTL